MAAHTGTARDRNPELDHDGRSQEDRHPLLLERVLLLPAGGVEALLVRTQLIVPNDFVLSADFYNQMFTMHAVTMVFLALMPLTAAFFNYMIPLQIGARDVAFPRLNALSYWIYFFGAIFINLGFFLNALPNAGWFAYANLTSPAVSRPG
jgi:cytochrome c oxidase subunit I